jgi:hypothetical protein
MQAMQAFNVIPCHPTRVQALAWASNKRAQDAAGATAEEVAIKMARRLGASP